MLSVYHYLVVSPMFFIVFVFTIKSCKKKSVVVRKISYYTFLIYKIDTV